MKVENYLHLYLGCDVRSTSNKYMGKLVGCDVDAGATVSPHDRFDPRVTLKKYLKPILRPLSDMDDDEAHHFAWLCLDSKHHLDKDSRVTRDEIETDLVRNDGGNMLDGDVEIYIGVLCRCFEGYIAIMTDGRIGIGGEDEPSEKMKPIDSISEKIDWLRKQFFDLDGLINAGLAIDKTTLENATA